MARAITPSRRLPWGAALLLAVPLLACGDSSDGDQDGGTCSGGKCDASGEGVADLLEGQSNPIANALRAMAQGDDAIARLPTDEELDVAAIREAGGPDQVLAIAIDAPPAEGFPAGMGGYVALLRGIADDNCGDVDAINTYVIADDLVAGESMPRVVATTCNTDTRKAMNAFVALSFPDGNGDVDAHAIEAFGWERSARTNSFYRSIALEGTEEGVLMIVNPLDLEGELGGCGGCHGGPADTPEAIAEFVPNFPIMNELVEPWSHWFSAGFGGDSQLFDVPNAASMPKYLAMTTGEDGNVDTGDWLNGASRFESIVREGFNQVATQRRRRLREDANVDEALALLRPMFCEEQINFASEIGVSGEMHLGAVVDEGIRRSIQAADIGASWPWATGTEASVLFAPSSSVDEAIELVPMRGQSAIAYEEKLTTSLQQYYPGAEMLRVRALDWQTPVFSDFRCQQFERVASAPPAVTGSGTNYDAMLVLWDAMLELPGGTPLAPSADGHIIVLDTADRADALAADLEAGTVPVVTCAKDETCDYTACDERGYCEMNLWAFGERIDDYVRSFQNEQGRQQIIEARRQRLCKMQASGAFPMAPALPGDFSCG